MPRFEPFDWYRTPLYYDIIFDADTPQEADFLDAMARFYLPESIGPTASNPVRVLEPACGTGRLVAALARRGYAVRGFDLAEPSLAFARRRLDAAGLHAELHHAAMQEFDLGEKRFDLAHCLVSSFKYLLSEDDARSHLRCVARALKPGGVYVLGLHLTDYADRARNRERWTARRDALHVVCNIQGWPADRRARIERVRSRLTVTDERTGEVRRCETTWSFRTYSLRQLRTLLDSVLEFEHIETYDFRHDPMRPIPFDGRQLDNVLILRRR